MIVYSLCADVSENCRSSKIVNTVLDAARFYKTVDRLFESLPIELWPEICRSTKQSKHVVELFLIDFINKEISLGISEEPSMYLIYALRSLIELGTKRGKDYVIDLCMKDDLCTYDVLFVCVYWLSFVWHYDKDLDKLFSYICSLKDVNQNLKNYILKVKSAKKGSKNGNS